MPEYSVPVPAFRTLLIGHLGHIMLYYRYYRYGRAHGSAWGVPILVTLLGHESAWLGMAWHAWRGCMAWLHAECGFHGLACSLYWFRFREPAEDRSNGAISAVNPAHQNRPPIANRLPAEELQARCESSWASFFRPPFSRSRPSVHETQSFQQPYIAYTEL